EAGRRLSLPEGKGRFGRQSVECVIDLHRVEVARVEGEPVADAQARRVEDAAPVPVDPTGRADPHLTPFCHGLLPVCRNTLRAVSGRDNLAARLTAPARAAVPLAGG